MPKEPGDAPAVEILSRSGVHGLFGIGVSPSGGGSLARGKAARHSGYRRTTTVSSSLETASPR
jgi:hypothetical protein